MSTEINKIKVGQVYETRGMGTVTVICQYTGEEFKSDITGMFEVQNMDTFRQTMIQKNGKRFPDGRESPWDLIKYVSQVPIPVRHTPEQQERFEKYLESQPGLLELLEQPLDLETKITEEDDEYYETP